MTVQRLCTRNRNGKVRWGDWLLHYKIAGLRGEGVKLGWTVSSKVNSSRSTVRSNQLRQRGKHARNHELARDISSYRSIWYQKWWNANSKAPIHRSMNPCSVAAVIPTSQHHHTLLPYTKRPSNCTFTAFLRALLSDAAQAPQSLAH